MIKLKKTDLDFLKATQKRWEERHKYPGRVVLPESAGPLKQKLEDMGLLVPDVLMVEGSGNGYLVHYLTREPLTDEGKTKLKWITRLTSSPWYMPVRNLFAEIVARIFRGWVSQ